LPAVTALKLGRLQRNHAMCEAALTTADWRTTPVPKLSSPNGICTVKDAIRVDTENTVFGSGFNATCPLSVGMAMLVRRVVQPAARQHFGTEVARVDHLGTFACRRIRGGSETAGLSEHAAANAIDITGFVLRGGREITVTKDWNGDEKNAAFL